MKIIEKTYNLNGALAIRIKTDEIILHHRAGTGDVESIDKLHKSNGWSCIGYHFYIRKDGKIYRGRPIESIGAHTNNHNKNSIGICFEGNFDTEEMTDEQIESGKWLIKEIEKQYGKLDIKKHNDYSATACPGKNFPFYKFVSCETVSNKTIIELANAVIQGDYGTGEERKKLLGKRYKEVQAEVNKILKVKSLHDVALDVIAGKYGNQPNRKENLENAGFDYEKVQDEVNKILKG
jgi:N-acetylmuramoyl-L-alanine amidase